MRRLILTTAFVVISASVLQADGSEDAAKKLNGSYQVVAYLVNGQPDNKKKDSVDAFIVKDGTISVKEGEKVKDTIRFKLDPTKKPAEIDIVPDGKVNKSIPGIYEVKETDKGTELTIAFVKGGSGVRPKDFKAEGKDGVVLKLFRKKEK